MTITYMGWSSFQECMDLPRSGEGRADSIEAKLAIDRLAHRIVYPGDHPGDLEDLFCNLGRHDVAIVPIGEGGEAIRRLDSRLAEHVLVDPVAEHHLSAEIAAEPVKGTPIAIDDRDLMPCLGQRKRGHGADPSATDDHQLHEWKTHSMSSGRAQAGQPQPRAVRPGGSWPGWSRRRRAPARNGRPTGPGRPLRRRQPGSHRAAGRRSPG